MLIQVFRAWRKWHKNWDDLCNRCGKCCFERYVARDGYVFINYSAPCEFLNLDTHLCTVFPERFRVCSHCGKVNLWVVLFNDSLPLDCAYRTTFKPWEKKKWEAKGWRV